MAAIQLAARVGTSLWTGALGMISFKLSIVGLVFPHRNAFLVCAAAAPADNFKMARREGKGKMRAKLSRRARDITGLAPLVDLLRPRGLVGRPEKSGFALGMGTWKTFRGRNKLVCRIRARRRLDCYERSAFVRGKLNSLRLKTDDGQFRRCCHERESTKAQTDFFKFDA